ncbi:BOS complex subunit TMEM147-like [Paramacrobiotus metropolitanus]|uniref:BOS complex subunit TMEM147-like n=1 Tax=Paramacrobiotus metropolitanus TaxID=2943436 RepID=UPI002445BCC9|nr:BOS complex subunit TMEM147-like [Paramacrobiotus metropolitanus]
MTFYHLVNCVALAVLPYLATYRFYNLSEYRAFWKCFYAACIFFAAQLVKMLILASIFPVVDSHATSLSVSRLTYDFLRLSVDLIDLAALHHIVNKLTLKGDLKFVATGLGWAFAELLAFRVMPFWLEARGSEFSWVHLMSAMEANINLVYYISIAAMLWALSRNDFNKALQPAVLGLLVLSTYRPLLLEVLSHTLHLDAWFGLLFKGVYSLILGVVALGLCTALTET